ncbi:MAG: Na(+)-translocating NADH-quinone reductase subunit A [Bacteroidetes bacterium]|nr:Na(+)-translocating NADH-quinone reductase subunit A [Bacteroidota bacterium]MBL7102764.1 Na(+)-translocating NADH-quinone reductase subunit A [Bacteroidales bacterium]
MSKVIRISKGLDIKLLGEAEKKVTQVSSDNFALKPPDFVDVFPKLFLKEGDEVKAGTPVFFNKYRDNIILTSPVSGKVTEIRRGAKRKMLEIRIESDGKMNYEDFGKADPASLSKEKIIEKLLKSGIWAQIRQRPYSVIADPKDEPKAIFISAFNSAPLAPDYDFILDEESQAFQAGLNALGKLTSGKIHLNINNGKPCSKTFLEAKGVQINRFKGPHPAGNIGVQIYNIDPINKGDIVWYISPQAVVTVGKLFFEGKYNASRIIALTGSEVIKPQYFKVIAGTLVTDLFKNNINSGNVRYISGNVLTGSKIERDGYLGFYNDQITVIPEGDYYEFLGWSMPRINKFSFSRTFVSWLFPNKKYRLDTNLNGGQRAFVLTGEYEKVFPMNIYPMQLLKAIIVKDIDLMENLGIYEVDEEDFALCEFIDASKTEMQAIVREGLDYMRKEME